MHTFSTPGSIGPVELNNRIIMAPMGLHYPGGFTREVAEFYKERARGGAGMIIIGGMIDSDYNNTDASLVFTNENKYMLREICDTAHEHGCKVALQIMLGTGRIGASSPRFGVPASCSEIPILKDPNIICHALTKPEIEQLKSDYRRAIEIGVECGIDAVETHSYGGYLLDQFLTKRWNKRTDEYGGDLSGRMRLLCETLDIVKEVGQGKLGIICKITPDHLLPTEDGYRGMDEGIELSKRLEAYGVHALHICAGCYENWENGMPCDYFQETVPHMHSADVIRHNVNIPVIAHGRLSNVSKAKFALESGMTDYVAIARGMLADPELPHKVLSGRTDDITPCISCNEGCIANISRGNHVTCAVNPRCGYETERVLKLAVNPKRVLIVGAGPGWCSAAIYAKMCGHEVELWERSSHIGGNALAASMPVFKRDMEELLKYYKHELDTLGIRVRFMKEATPEAVAEYAPDHLIWAAGGIPVRPASIPGIGGINVCFATDALENLAYIGKRVVMIGGGMVGCEAAAHLGITGKDVTIVEMAPTILQEPLFVQNKTMLLKWMAAANLTIHESTKLVSIQSNSVTVERDGESFDIPCDTVCLAMGFRPSETEAEKYRHICPVTAIGDAAQPRKIMYAVADAMQAVLALDKE